jgi:hypothetical protein
MVFRYPDGAIHRVKRVFGSRLGQRWMRGEDMAPFVASQRDDGANSVRVFCQFHRGIALVDADIFHPGDSTPEQWRDFSRWLASQQMRVELTILADCPQFSTGHAAQVARVRSIVDACSGEPNVGIEISNEWFKNSDDPGQIARELGYLTTYLTTRPCLMATGDYSCAPGMVVLDWVGDHAERKIDHAIEAAKTGHFVNEGWSDPPPWRGSHGPVLEDETIGLKEGVPDFDGRRESRPGPVEDAYAGFAVGMAGATVFSDAHHAADVPGPGVRTLTQLAFLAMDDVPLDMPTGSYVHDGFGNHPLASLKGLPADQNAGEVAGRVLGNRAYLVASDPGVNYKPVPVGGWRIVRTNTRGNITYLEKP